MLKKKIWPNFRFIELFTQKIVTKLSKKWVWDPRSGIRKKPIPDPGSRGQKGTGSRIPDPDPQHWWYELSVPVLKKKNSNKKNSARKSCDALESCQDKPAQRSRRKSMEFITESLNFNKAWVHNRIPGFQHSWQSSWSMVPPVELVERHAANPVPGCPHVGQLIQSVPTQHYLQSNIPSFIISSGESFCYSQNFTKVEWNKTIKPHLL